MQAGARLAAVQRPPDPFLGVVLEGPLPGALRARPLDSWRMLGPDIDPALLHIQRDPTDGPWNRSPQTIRVERGVLHGCPLLGGWRPCDDTLLPTEKPEEPKKILSGLDDRDAHQALLLVRNHNEPYRKGKPRASGGRKAANPVRRSLGVRRSWIVTSDGRRVTSDGS